MGSNVPGAELANSMSFMDVQMGNKSANVGFTQIQQKVYDILQQCNVPNGRSRTFILERFPANQQNAVKYAAKYFVPMFLILFVYYFSQALEFLSFEGHVYTTIDSDHFMATTSM